MPNEDILTSGNNTSSLIMGSSHLDNSSISDVGGGGGFLIPN
jgi:hypothetical protein